MFLARGGGGVWQASRGAGMLPTPRLVTVITPEEFPLASIYLITIL